MLSENVHIYWLKNKGKDFESSLCLSWNEAKTAHNSKQALDMERKSLIRQLSGN